MKPTRITLLAIFGIALTSNATNPVPLKLSAVRLPSRLATITEE